MATAGACCILAYIIRGSGYQLLPLPSPPNSSPLSWEQKINLAALTLNRLLPYDGDPFCPWNLV